MNSLDSSSLDLWGQIIQILKLCREKLSQQWKHLNRNRIWEILLTFRWHLCIWSEGQIKDIMCSVSDGSVTTWDSQIVAVKSWAAPEVALVTVLASSSDSTKQLDYLLLWGTNPLSYPSSGSNHCDRVTFPSRHISILLLCATNSNPNYSDSNTALKVSEIFNEWF